MNLLTLPDGRSIHRTFAWIVPGTENKLESIKVTIDPPALGVPNLPIADLKAWLLSGDESHRILTYQNAKGRMDYRKVSASIVFSEYVHAVLDRAGLSSKEKRSIRLLMPALADNQAHFRYRDALVGAVSQHCPEADIITVSEPEMTLEFFRLVKGLAHVRKGQNAFFLVCDSGASTTNFTIIISTRAGDVTDATRRRRTHKLRPISLDAAQLAGHAVNADMLDRLAPDLPTSPPALRDQALADLERAKLRVVRTSSPETLRLPTGDLLITPDMVRAATHRLWKQLAPHYEKVAHKVIQQFSSTTADESYASLLSSRSVTDWKDVGQLFDAVFVAGGNSLLPGFLDDLRSTIQLAPGTKIHTVGGAYPVAAAIGGLAHALRARGSGKRDELTDEALEDLGDELQTSLQWDLVLDCQDRTSKPSQPPRITLVERNSALASNGGSISFQLPTSWKKGMRARARLIPGGGNSPEERLTRKGLGFARIKVVHNNATGTAEFNSDEQYLKLRSIEAPELGELRLDAKRLSENNGQQPGIRRNSAGLLNVYQSADVVIDIGMSKTVIAVAEAPGQVHPDEFDTSDSQIPETPGFNLLGPSLPKQNRDNDGSAEDVHLPITATNAVSSPRPTRLRPVVVLRKSIPADEARTVVPLQTAQPTAVAPRLPQHQKGNHLGGSPLESPLTLADPVARVREVVKAAAVARLDVNERELALLYLALCTRRFVLLAGPPGCGKSTLGRLVGRMLGCVPGHTFVDLSVQAHWVNDEHLFGKQGAISELMNTGNGLKLALFDELNMTRPEYYLARTFGILDGSGEGRLNGSGWSNFGIIGTLNVDDLSRPPSPKVLDRAMLLLMAPNPYAEHSEPRCAWNDPLEGDLLPELGPPRRGTAFVPRQLSDESRARVFDWVIKARDVLSSHHAIRPDLIPSRRAIDDVLRFVALHQAMGLGDLVELHDALDQAIVGRFIAPISGAESEVKPLLTAWQTLCDDLPETKRRLGRLSKQLDSHGFVSFWH